MGGYLQRASGTRAAGHHGATLDFAPLMGWMLTAVALTLSVSLLGPQPVRASTLENLSSRANAERVLIARVATVRSYEDPAVGVRTVVGFDEARAVRGSTAVSFEIELAGGTVGSTVVRTSDTPTFRVGETVVLSMDAEGRLLGGETARLTVRNGTIVETGESVERLTGRVMARQVSASVRRSFPETFGLVSSQPSMSGSLPAASAPTATSATAPVADAVSPAIASAGTLEQVTITGSGFGETAGCVEFFYHPGQPTIVAGAAEIVSWSDTRVVTRVPVGTVGGYAGASASSGPVVVVSADGQRSTSLPFQVSFGRGPAKWNADSTTFLVNPNCADIDNELELVARGAAVWADRSNFSLAYAGTAAAPVVGDGANDISWDALPEGILGQASLMFVNGTMIEADVTLNDLYEWGDATRGADVDVATVIAHELGHWLSLRDLYGEADASKIMCGTLSFGQTRRAPSPADIAGIVHLYGSIGNEAPVTNALVTPSAWTSGTATVELTAQDATPGVAASYFRVSGGAPTRYSGPIEIAQEGRVRVGYWSVDGEGLTEDETVATVRIDRSAPVTTMSVTPGADGLSRVVLTATDPLSGVAAIRYRLDGAPAVSGSEVMVSSAASHSIEFRSTDAVGNIESARTLTIEPVSTDASLARISGSDRYETAAAISRDTFAKDSTPHAVLATGASFADALAANGLAGALEAPVLLTPGTELHPAVVGELRRLGATDVTVVGGAGAIADDVVTTLEGLGYTVSRIAGGDRYETAAMIATQLRSVTGTAPARAFVVRGDAFADALSAAPYAYSQRIPILLSRPGELPAVTERAVRSIGIRAVTIVGGTSAVGTAVQNALESAGATTLRIAGGSRYATAASLLEYAIAQGWTAPDSVGIATGADFPDALGGGAAMGAMDGALVLTAQAELGAESAEAIALCAPTVTDVRVFGGDAAVAPRVVESIIGALAR